MASEPAGDSSDQGEIEMSGDHNMNQFTYGRAISGAERNWVKPGPTQTIETNSAVGRDMDMDARQISNIQDQMGHMENHIHFLLNAIDTLEKRLHPVLREEPGRPEAEVLSKSMSPMANTLQAFNRRLDNASRNLLGLVERLEV
jgi:hypothetical protein